MSLPGASQAALCLGERRPGLRACPVSAWGAGACGNSKGQPGWHQRAGRCRKPVVPAWHTQLTAFYQAEHCLFRKGPLTMTTEMDFCPAPAGLGKLGVSLDPGLHISTEGSSKRGSVCPGEHMVCGAPAQALAVTSQALPTWVASVLGTDYAATSTRPAIDCGGPRSKHRPW